MKDLLALAELIAERLRARGESVAVAESSAGGLVAASLLAQAGASAFFVGGAIVYTGTARQALLGIEVADMAGLRAATEPYAALLARRVRERLTATWGLAETGAAGPSGNRYGDAPGHVCVGLSDPLERVRTIASGSDNRVPNMRAFASEALRLLADALEGNR